MLQWITADETGIKCRLKKRFHILSYSYLLWITMQYNTSIQDTNTFSVSLCHRHWSDAVLLYPMISILKLDYRKEKCSKHWLYFKLLVLCDIIEREIPIRPSQNLLKRGNQTETSWHKWGGANSSFQTEDELSSPSVKCIRIILNNEWCKATVAEFKIGTNLLTEATVLKIIFHSPVDIFIFVFIQKNQR